MVTAFASSGVMALSSTRSTRFVCGSGGLRVARADGAARLGVRGSLSGATASLDDSSAPPGAEPAPMATEDCKLFVGNLSWDTTDHTLGDAFARYGTVMSARVIVDKFTGKSRGFGFIEYESAADADDALEGMQGVEVDGRRIRVDRANKRSDRPKRVYEQRLE